MIEVKEINDISVLIMPETLDSINSVDVVELVSSLIEKKKYKIIVDLNGTEFIDSSGLSSIIVKVSVIRSNGGDIRLACQQGYIRNQLKITRLDEVFQCHDTVEAAVSSFS